MAVGDTATDLANTAHSATEPVAVWVAIGTAAGRGVPPAAKELDRRTAVGLGSYIEALCTAFVRGLGDVDSSHAEIAVPGPCAVAA